VLDKRLGERNAAMSREERQTMRLAYSKRRELKKAQRYALADDDDDQLTHFGQSLANVQK
jgi:nucleolar protein 14